MQDTQNPVDLDNYVPCQLAAVSTRVTQSVVAMLKHRYDLSIPEWKVLATVAKHPRLSAVGVAHYAGLDTVAVSRAVTKLMDAGRIYREFGKEDRRRSILELSEEGRMLYQAIMPTAARLEASLLEDMNEEERQILQKAFESLAARAQALADAFEAGTSVTPTPATVSPRYRHSACTSLQDAITGRGQLTSNLRAS